MEFEKEIILFDADVCGGRIFSNLLGGAGSLSAMQGRRQNYLLFSLSLNPSL